MKTISETQISRPIGTSINTQFAAKIVDDEHPEFPMINLDLVFSSRHDTDSRTTITVVGIDVVQMENMIKVLTEAKNKLQERFLLLKNISELKESLKEAEKKL